MPTDQRIVDNLIDTGLRKKFLSEYFQLSKRNYAFFDVKEESGQKVEQVITNLQDKIDKVLEARFEDVLDKIYEEIILLLKRLMIMTVTLNFGGNNGKRRILTPYLDAVNSLIRTHLNEANEADIPEILSIILTAYGFKSLTGENKKDFYAKIVEYEIKKKLTGDDMYSRLRDITLFAGLTTFKSMWEKEKIKNEESDFKLTADEVFWIVYHKPHAIFERNGFLLPETNIDFEDKEEVKFLIKNGVSKANVDKLYQMEINPSHTFDDVAYKYGGTRLKLTHIKGFTRKNKKWSKKIEKEFTNLIMEHKIPARIETAYKLLKIIRNDVDKDEVVKLLIKINLEHKEFAEGYDNLEFKILDCWNELDEPVSSARKPHYI